MNPQTEYEIDAAVAEFGWDESDTLEDVLRGRDEGRDSELWGALMMCRDCDDRIIEHDQATYRCRVCSCNQSQRGLSSYADEHLMELGRALKAVYGTGGD